MATIETWATEKIAEYGAIYPMVGSEWVWLTAVSYTHLTLPTKA